MQRAAIAAHGGWLMSHLQGVFGLALGRPVCPIGAGDSVRRPKSETSSKETQSSTDSVAVQLVNYSRYELNELGVVKLFVWE